MILRMGQCTSGELPQLNDAVQNSGNEVCKNDERQESPAQNTPLSISKRYRQSSCSAATAWVSSHWSKRQKKKDLSATFNLFDHEIKGQLVDINSATEEELMTLPGVSRQLARNIVEYRTTLGGFRRTEDLVLVSGIGASVLQSILKDVTIKKYPSHSSSRTVSSDSLPSVDSYKSQKSLSANGQSVKSSPNKLINVNSASIFELMNIRGMSQEMAANIVHYRNKKGGFQHINEMVKIKGINHRILSLLRIYLVCRDGPSTSSPVTNDSMSISFCGKPPLPPPRQKLPGHRRCHSAPLQSNPNTCTAELPNAPSPNTSHRFSSDFSEDLFELLSFRSDRPFTYDHFNGSHEGHPAIRIGSWNLQQLSNDKVNNPGVLEVICRTILETGFSVIALQEVMSKDVPEKICHELNCGSLRRVREWMGPPGDWRWLVGDDPSWMNHFRTEYAAFIYNANHSLNLLSVCLLNVHNNNNNSRYSADLLRKPLIGYFKVNHLELVLVNINMKMSQKRLWNLNEEEEEEKEREVNGNGGSPSLCKSQLGRSIMGPLATALKEKLNVDRYVVYLGSFDLPPLDKAFSVLHDSFHTPVFGAGNPTDISFDHPEGRECVDNLWLSSHCHKLRTGTCGVVREGLSHMAIPRGWGWGGVVSDHCPIYCDLYTQVVVNRPNAICRSK